jgi:hypothetical protein
MLFFPLSTTKYVYGLDEHDKSGSVLFKGAQKEAQIISVLIAETNSIFLKFISLYSRAKFPLF